MGHTIAASGREAEAGTSSRLRVLAAIIVPPHITASGGAYAAEALSAALSGHCDITVASMMGGSATRARAGTPGRIPVATRLPFRMPQRWVPRALRSLFYRSDIVRLLGEGGYDLVHLHNPMPALEFGRIAAACRARRLPYVISTHGFNEIANGERVYEFGPARRLVWHRCVLKPVREAVRGAAGIFALSPADEPIVRAMGFAGTVTQVPNGVPRAVPGDAADDARLCASLGIAPEKRPGQLTMMFLANHTPNKGLRVLGEAIARLNIPYLLIIGGERRPSVDYGAFAQRGRPDQQVVVTGRLSDKAIPALLRRSDLFVFPSLADTFPLVVLEAMAQGLPVIASDLGGIPYQIGRHGGLLVPPGDPEALARAIESLAGDPARRNVMGLAARERVEQLFTWESAALEAVAGYRAALADAHRQKPVRRETPPPLSEPSIAPVRAPSFPR